MRKGLFTQHIGCLRHTPPYESQNLKSIDFGTYNMPQKLLSVCVDELPFHEERTNIQFYIHVLQYWVHKKTPGRSAKFEIRRLWCIQHAEIIERQS